MRTTIDIPDEMYRTIKVLAAERGDTFRDLVLEGLEVVSGARQQPAPKKFELPLIPSTRTDKLVIDNETIYDLIDFP
jgi:hypothetical protein